MLPNAGPVPVLTTVADAVIVEPIATATLLLRVAAKTLKSDKLMPAGAPLICMVRVVVLLLSDASNTTRVASAINIRV